MLRVRDQADAREDGLDVDTSLESITQSSTASAMTGGWVGAKVGSFSEALNMAFLELLPPVPEWSMSFRQSGRKPEAVLAFCFLAFLYGLLVHVIRCVVTVVSIMYNKS